jgi:hypothetical protein
VPPRPNHPEHSISMWGAPSSGKTTFLAALSIALNRQGRTWNVAGANEASEQVLIRLTTSLANHGFPAATQGIERYRWVLNGRIPRISRSLFRERRYDEPVKIGLDLVDASGEITHPSQVGLPERNELIDDVVRSRGIVYIFDPIEEFDKGNAFDHTFGLVTQLARRMDEEPGSFDGRLPHHVAVCVTKFDEIRVFETAEKLDLLMVDDADPYGFPRVADDDARELFTRLCEVSGSGNGEMVINLLEQYFRPERIHYFITSAIGFYLHPRIRVYDPDDPQNLLPDDSAPGSFRVRGAVHPINVVEPLLWLSHQMLGEPDGAGARP